MREKKRYRWTTEIFNLGMVGTVLGLPVAVWGQTVGPETILRSEELPGVGVWEHRTAFDGTAGYVAWMDLRSDGLNPDDIYAQKVNADGSVAWTANGLPVCTADQVQDSMRLSPDGSGGLIVVWSDERQNESQYTDIYGQWINPDGSLKWDQDGLPLGGVNDNDQYQPNVHHIAGDEFYLTHGVQLSVSGPDEYWLVVHRINASGQQLWDPDGFQALEGVRIMSSVLDGEGGLVVFGRIREGNEGYRFQRVSSNQTLVWESPVEILADLPNYSSSNPYFAYAADGVGGVLIAYYTAGTLRVARVAADGSKPWGETGILITENTLTSQLPDIIGDGEGGAFVAWIEDGLPDRLRVQHIQSDGTLGWTPGGVEMPGSASAFFNAPCLAPDGSGGLFVSYQISSRPWVQRVDANGTTLWDSLGTNGLDLVDGIAPKIGLGANGLIAVMDTGAGLASRIVTGLKRSLVVGTWAETEIGWVYGLTPDWGSSAYMDYVYLANLPYLYQVNLGWLYLAGSNRPEHVLFDYELGWILTNEGWGGYYYIYATGTYGQFSQPQP
jgi:hypothetical protein